MTAPVDDDRRAWLQRVRVACEHAQARLAEEDERQTVDLRAAIDDLHARLTRELDELE